MNRSLNELDHPRSKRVMEMASLKRTVQKLVVVCVLLAQTMAANGSVAYACEMMNAWLPHACCCGTAKVQAAPKDDACCAEVSISAESGVLPAAGQETPRTPTLIAVVEVLSPPVARVIDRAPVVYPDTAFNDGSRTYLNTGRLRL